jgi:RHS repeat-associated protein
MRSLRKNVLARILSVLVSLLLVVPIAPLLMLQPQAAYASPQDPVTPTSSSSSSLEATASAVGTSPPSVQTKAPSPTAPSLDLTRTTPVEIPSRRTEYATHYLMPDGSYWCELSSQRVRYKQPDGTWKNINSHVVPDEQFGVSRNASNDLAMQFGNWDSGVKPVHIAKDDWTLDMQPLAGFLGDQVDAGDVAQFSAIATDTDLTYESRPDGVKETLILHSAAAPAAFSFKLTFTGLDLRGDDASGWAFYRSGSFKPVLALGALTVADSATETSVCAGARMSVNPGQGSALITVSLPATWLADPARVFPVNVDPSVYAADNADTWISQENPSTNYGSSTTMTEGKQPTYNNYYDALVKFDVANCGLGGTSYIDNTTLKVYADAASTAEVMGIGRAYASWTEGGATWNNGPSQSFLCNTTIPTAAGWVQVSGDSNIRSTVRNWWYGSSANYGFELYWHDTTKVVRTLHSRENANYPPSLGIGYVTPSLSISTNEQTATADDSNIVSATVAVATGSTHGAEGDVSHVHVYDAGTDFVWDSGSTIDTSTYTYVAGGGGQFGYNTANNASKVTALTDQWSVSTVGATKYVTFVWRVKPGFGDAPGNQLAAHVEMGGPGRWAEDAVPVALGILPAALLAAPSYVTTTSTGWFYEHDTNGDGVNEAKDNANTSGRGAVTLSWSAAGAATGYHVYLSDGARYRQVATSTATSWSSAGKGLFPSDTTISALATGTTSNPFLPGTGLDLRDNPALLYAKTTATSTPVAPYYNFKVLPYNSQGEATTISAAATVTVALENRTVGVSQEPQHATYGLGDLLHHDGNVDLERGSLELGTSDLSINTWGPAAELTRHYSSSATSATSFAPGWRFNYEQHIETATTTYVDSSGDRYRFVYDSGAGCYRSPAGYGGRLIRDGTGYHINLADRSRLDFDLTSGLLTLEADKNGNSTSYVVIAGDVVITAANGQSIVVHRDLTGRALSATYATVDGTRTVTYCGGSGYTGGTSASVNYFAGTSDAYDANYAYGDSGTANNRLTALSVPQYVWGDDTVTFGYDVNGEMYTWSPHQGAWSSPAGSISYDGTAASIWGCGKNAGGAADGTYVWNSSGTMATETAGSFYSGGTWVDSSGEQHTYDASNREISDLSPLGHLVKHLYDANGNPTVEWDETAAISSYVYDANNQCIQQTDPLGSATSRQFDATGNLLTEDRQLNATDSSHISYSYNASGTATRELKQLTTTETAETDYSNFAPCGEPQTILQVGVRLSGASPATCTLSSYKTYDSFGNLTSEKGASGRWVAKHDTYTVSGHLASAEVVTGTIATYIYNGLGDEWQTSVTAGSDYTNWTWEIRDPRGLVIESSKDNMPRDNAVWQTSLPDSHGNLLQTQHENNSVDHYVYDDHDNCTSEQGPGMTHPRLRTYDAEDRVTGVTEPGNNQGTATTYSTNGQVLRVDNPDGTWVTTDYDAAGNPTRETRPTENGTASTTNAYDLGGRLSSTTDEESGTTTYGYDLADRHVSAGIVGSSGSTTVYNSVGWPITQTDADGIVTNTTYDPAGRVATSTVGGNSTTTSYDGAGRVVSVTDPDGRTVNYAYDAFSRQVREWQTVGGTTTHDTRTAYDHLSHALESSEVVGDVVRTTEFCGDNPALSVTNYAGATSTAVFDYTGAETSRSVNAGAISFSRSVTHDVQNRPTTSTVTGLGSQRASYDAESHITSQTGYGWNSGATYTYGSAGRKTEETLSVAATTAPWTGRYTYTDDGRLSSASIDGSCTTYAYNTSGDVTGDKPSGSATVTLSYDSGDHLTSMGSTTYGWDLAHGWRTSSQRSGESSVTYGFSSGGRLVTYVDPNRSVTATFAYDGAGQRTSSIVTSGSPSVTTTTTYIYDGLSLLSLSAVASNGTTYSLTYFNSEAGRPFAAVYAGSGRTATLVYLVTTDRGDVVELLDSAGSPFASYRYDAWGSVRSAPSSPTASIDATAARNIASRQPLRYAGYCYDTFSILYYLSARYYDPASRQFISKDSAKADGEESAYQYCDGNPVAFSDSSGMSHTLVLTSQTVHPTYTYKNATYRLDFSTDWSITLEDYFAHLPLTQYRDPTHLGMRGTLVTNHSKVVLHWISGKMQRHSLRLVKYVWRDGTDASLETVTLPSWSAGVWAWDANHATQSFSTSWGYRYDWCWKVNLQLYGTDGKWSVIGSGTDDVTSIRYHTVMYHSVTAYAQYYRGPCPYSSGPN